MSERCVRSSLYLAGAPLLALLLLFNAPATHAQDMPIISGDESSKPADPKIKVPSYDVASVKENKSGDGMMRIMMKPDGFESVNLSLKNLIANAYGIKQDLIFGLPNWASTKGFDVNAKVAGPDVELLKKLSPRESASMLQPVLVERFHLKIHTETKILPTYDLTVAKGGVKMKQAAPDPAPAAGAKEDESDNKRGNMTMGPGEFSGEDLPLAAIANQISYIVHHTVADKTGLVGKYDLTLKYALEDGPKKDDGSSDEPSPSIFTAVQDQLGLKLTSTKGPVEILVIDHVEEPSDN